MKTWFMTRNLAAFCFLVNNGSFIKGSSGISCQELKIEYIY